MIHSSHGPENMLPLLRGKCPNRRENYAFADIIPTFILHFAGSSTGSHPIHLSLTRAAADYHGASLTLFYNYLANSTNKIGGFLSLRICSIQICPLTVENNPCGPCQSKTPLPKAHERCHRMLICSIEGINVNHIAQQIYSFNAATHSISTSEPMGRPATLTQVLAYTVLKISRSS